MPYILKEAKALFDPQEKIFRYRVLPEMRNEEVFTEKNLPTFPMINGHHDLSSGDTVLLILESESLYRQGYVLGKIYTSHPYATEKGFSEEPKNAESWISELETPDGISTLEGKWGDSSKSKIFCPFGPNTYPLFFKGDKESLFALSETCYWIENENKIVLRLGSSFSIHVDKKNQVFSITNPTSEKDFIIQYDRKKNKTYLNDQDNSQPAVDSEVLKELLETIIDDINNIYSSGVMEVVGQATGVSMEILKPTAGVNLSGMRLLNNLLRKDKFS